MRQKGFTLIEVILGLAIFTLMVGVIARSVVSVNDLYKEGQLIKDLTALREAIQNYYTAQGNYPGNITDDDLLDYMPRGWQNKSPFGYPYELTIVSSIARIQTPITDTINPAHLSNTYAYTDIAGARYVRSEIIVPRENFNAQWERKYIYETTQGAQP